MYLEKRWTTHLPILMELVKITEGTILEFGSGLFSTPFLHWVCIKNNRKFITLENNLKYWGFCRQFKSKNHIVKFIEDWDKIEDIVSQQFSIILIDHEPMQRRGKDAILVKDSADFIVLHDTETKNEHLYNYDKIWKYFKYRYDYEWYYPRTTIVSNRVNLDFLNELLKPLCFYENNGSTTCP
jgi:hypothetical protein